MGVLADHSSVCVMMRWSSQLPNRGPLLLVRALKLLWYSLVFSAGAWWFYFQNTAQSSASFSSQTTASSNSKERREFSLSVNVTAVQDELPGGLKKILSILERGFITANK